MAQNQNLLSHARINEADVDRSPAKIFALAALGVAGAASSGFALGRYAGDPTAANFWLLAAPLLAFLLAILLQTFFVKSFGKVAAMNAAYTFALLAPLAANISPQVLLGGALALGFLLGGSYWGGRELKDRVKIRFFRVSRAALGKAATGLALFLTLYYLGTQPNGFIISQPLFEQLVLPGATITERFLPGISLTDTFRNAVAELAANQAAALPGFAALGDAERREILARSVAELEERAVQLLGIDVRPDARIVDLLYESLRAKLADLTESGRQLAFLAIATSVFFAIRGAGILFVWAAIGIGFVLYEILIALGFATVVLEGTSREIIVL